MREDGLRRSAHEGIGEQLEGRVTPPDRGGERTTQHRRDSEGFDEEHFREEAREG